MRRRSFAIVSLFLAVPGITAVASDKTLLWIKQTQDCSSAATGSSVFDFEGDGKAEVIYGDETTLHVDDGASGTELFKTCNTNGTHFEYPFAFGCARSQADLQPCRFVSSRTTLRSRGIARRGRSGTSVRSKRCARARRPERARRAGALARAWSARRSVAGSAWIGLSSAPAVSSGLASTAHRRRSWR